VTNFAAKGEVAAKWRRVEISEIRDTASPQSSDCSLDMRVAHDREGVLAETLGIHQIAGSAGDAKMRLRN
jgi:hypothetical protein